MKQATIYQNNESQVLVIFGRVDKGGEFFVSHAKQSRIYKTVKAAQKAKQVWENA